MDACAAHRQDSPGGIQAITVSDESGSHAAEALAVFYIQFQPYNEQGNVFQTKL